MHQGYDSQNDLNQPQIKTETNEASQKGPSTDQNPQSKINPENHSQDEEVKKSMEMIKHIRSKHPECVPVFYVKHEASPKEFPSPKIPFILFKKDLKIQQAMYNLYNQIQIKGLYFFCTRYDQKQKKMKYVVLKPGQTIEQVFKKYGKNDHLTLIYGDKTIGMGGVNKMEKWLIRIMVFLLTIWVILMAYPMLLAYQEGGLPAVWNTLSLMWKKHDRDPKTDSQLSETSNQSNPTLSQKQNHQYNVNDLGDSPQDSIPNIKDRKNDWQLKEVTENDSRQEQWL